MLLAWGCVPPAPEPSGAAQPVTRIVTLAPHLAELVYAAGAGDRLVGVSSYSDYPAAVSQLPVIGDAFRVDYEAIAALAPDLVLSWQSGNPAPLVDRLRNLGYRVLSMEAETLAEVADQIELIGELAGTTEIAGTAAAAYRDRLASLASKYRREPALPVFYQLSVQPLLTVSRRHLIGQVLEVCGGVSLFAELDEPVPAVALEAVVEAEPPVIIASSPLRGREPELGFWRDWQTVPAVRDERIYVVDADLLSRPGPRLLDGARQVCEYLAAVRAD
jgi:iron complex transport system substrate-binding protein